MPNHPLAEVFGFPTNNFSDRAKRYRKNHLCPYNNRVPSCTKSRLKNPIGVCSLYDGERPTIICPVRFRQEWFITSDSVGFFFPENQKWAALTEIRLNDKEGNTAGNIDMVLVSFDNNGIVQDFGVVEVQSVYISGNISNPFNHYISNPSNRQDMDWTGQKNYPRPDYLSSTRKRLAPQLIYKGNILNAWGKKIVVVVHNSLFNTLPNLPETTKEEADVAWHVYDLEYDSRQNLYNIKLGQTVYTLFKPALDKITSTEPGDIQNFIQILQEKLNEKLEESPPKDISIKLDLLEL